jgi:hypothetical protein
MSEVETLLRQRITFVHYQAFHSKCSRFSICNTPRTIATRSYGTQSLCRPRASTLIIPKLRSLKAKNAYVFQRLVWLHQSSTNIFSRHEHNAQESPLLRMPPEVRNKIYEYTLGGNALHIFRNPNQPSMSTTRLGCKACVSPCRCSVRITAFLVSHNDRHRLHHHVCYTNVFGYRLDLSLLHSCSQIYMEASLLPFTQNHFIFGETKLFPLFTSKLALAQAVAITSLSLDNITVFDLFDDCYWTPFPSLRGLSVTVRGHNGCTDDNTFWLSGCRKLNRIWLQNTLQWWREDPAYAPLGQLNLETFRFRLVCSSGYRQLRCQTLREWNQWAKMVEREVSTRWTKREAQKRREEMRLLQAAEWPTEPWLSRWSLREMAWDAVEWFILRLPIWTRLLSRKIWP